MLQNNSLSCSWVNVASALPGFCRTVLFLSSLSLLSLCQAQVPASDRQHWYGSEEFLALPAQLHKTEMLTLKLESLTKSIPHVSEELLSVPCEACGSEGSTLPELCTQSSGDGTQVDLQDVDDWELTELNTDWDVGESWDNLSGDDAPSPLV